jgi:hypothetical protein
MAAISLSIKTGFDGFRIADFTVATNAPAANDIELRWNTTDANSNSVTLKEVSVALEAFQRAILSGSFFITPSGL